MNKTTTIYSNGQPPLTVTKAPKRNSKEWKRMFRELIAKFGGDGSDVNGFEAWQYMGTFNGEHEFRHRSHAVHGRIVWSTPAQ